VLSVQATPGAHVLEAGEHTEPFPHWVSSSLPASQGAPSIAVHANVVLPHLNPSAQSASDAQLTPQASETHAYPNQASELAHGERTTHDLVSAEQSPLAPHLSGSVSVT
jgi:hypothetical protein